MIASIRIPALVFVMLALSACSLPRGAAIQREILKEQDAENPSFQVLPLTRAVTPFIAQWPKTGWSGGYNWLQADRGPDSNVIRTGDKLDIVVWDSQDNSLLAAAGTKQSLLPSMTVSSSGAIFMPYVGKVDVNGLSQSALRDKLQDQLSGISPSAQVQVAVTPGRNNSVDVVSGVGAPGKFPLESRDTKILGVIAQAGGINSALRNPLVQLQRDGRDYETPATALLSDPRRNIRVRGGDQIIITEDERNFTVFGAAGTEQVMYFETDDMSAMEAISAMGGLNDGRANPKGILILREYSPRQVRTGLAGPNKPQVVFTLDLTTADGLFAARHFQINPEDTVIVSESPVNSVQTIFGLIGTVIGTTTRANNL